MLKLSIKVEPGQLVLDKKLLRSTLRSAGTEVAAVARSLVRTSVGTGPLVRGRRASAPGQSPVNQTGTLAKSFKVTPSRSGLSVTVANFAQSLRGSHAPYAKFLEEGAKGGLGSGKKNVKGVRNIRRRGKLVILSSSRVLQPRPFLTTALAQREESIAKRVADSINQGLKFVREKP